MTGKQDEHLLVIHRYFWPENLPYAIMLKDIVERVRSHFGQVTVASGDPAENIALREQWAAENNVELIRYQAQSVRKRSKIVKALQMLSYLFWLLRVLLKTKATVVMVATTPPIFAAQIVRWLSHIKGYRYIYHCQDIHPESMHHSGAIRSNILLKLLAKIDKKNVAKAWKVITLSKDMQATFAARGNNTNNVVIINNFIFNSRPVVPEAIEATSIRFLFAGSLSYFQNLEFLVQALTQVKIADVEFTFLGDGPLRKKLEDIVSQAGVDFIKFKDFVPVDEAVVEMHKSDFGIVSLAEKVTAYAYPSKSMMYLGNGLPILGLVDSDTELMCFINENQLGVAVAPNSEQAVVNAVENLVSRVKEFRSQREHIQALANQYFHKDVILEKFKKAIVND
ncbi:MAG: glycosyltransferase family 4 protein [Gammaproteobacteria bacterium]|nr:glycosyltransferase family 4 protein [Gammaproteobacteria bacterium]